MFPKPQTRVIRNSQGALRTYVRYPGQSRWYRSLATAQIALQRGGRS